VKSLPFKVQTVLLSSIYKRSLHPFTAAELVHIMSRFIFSFCFAVEYSLLNVAYSLGQTRIVLEKSVVASLYNEISRLSSSSEFSTQQCCDLICGLVLSFL
jgi:hypothetical protein